MRAGTLDRKIIIERPTTTIDDFGAPQQTWATTFTPRAMLIQGTIDEFIRSYGASSEAVGIFRIRYRDGIALGDRVTYKDRVYVLKEIKEIGRRETLELRCVAVGPT